MSDDVNVKFPYPDTGTVTGTCPKCNQYITLRKKDVQRAALAWLEDQIEEEERLRQKWLDLRKLRMKAAKDAKAAKKRLAGLSVSTELRTKLRAVQKTIDALLRKVGGESQS